MKIYLLQLRNVSSTLKKTDFVGFIIKPGQISIDPKKIKAIVNWQDPKSIIDLKLFLGFCNYYRRFIAKQSDETEPFTKMTKKKFGTGMNKN